MASKTTKTTTEAEAVDPTEAPRLTGGPAEGASHPGIVATGDQRAGETFLGEGPDGVPTLQKHPGGVKDKFIVNDPANGDVAPVAETTPEAARLVVAED